MATWCTRCGAEDPAEGMSPGWSLATSERGVLRLCEACTPAHVRDIEAKLDETWWE